MSRMIGALVGVVMMAAGARMARAQDAGTMAAMQASQMSMQAAQQANQIALQASQQAMQQAIDSNNFNYAKPPLPMTPRPMISPGGGRFKGDVKVAIQDADPKAIVFYTTDGSVPTPGSQRYVGPIVVSSKVKVRAMAFDLEEMPSGVVSKTFKVTS